MHHWELAWSTLKPLTASEVERCVDAVARLGCSLPQFDVTAREGRIVAVRHRQDDEFLLEFGFGSETADRQTIDVRRGLIEHGHIAWNWCCTNRRQPETGLLVHKFRQLQAITGDKLLVWDDDGTCHWSWGSCRLEEAGIDPEAVVDAHLKSTTLPYLLPKAS